MYDDDYIFLMDSHNNPMMLLKNEYLKASNTTSVSQKSVQRTLFQCFQSGSSLSLPFELVLPDEVQELAKLRYLLALITGIKNDGE